MLGAPSRPLARPSRFRGLFSTSLTPILPTASRSLTLIPLIPCRLRAKGLEFTDIPTQAEIESIRVKYEAQKDLEGLDTSLVLDSSRKRAHAEDGSGGGEEEDKVPVKSKYSRHTYASDEEAEF